LADVPSRSNLPHRRAFIRGLAASPALLGAGALLAPAGAAELLPATVAAFDRYVQESERAAAAGTFLWIDSLPDAARRTRLDAMRQGALAIERMTTTDNGQEIAIPNGLVHHWLGAVFVPGGTVERALALLQDYDSHADVYWPAVARSRVLARDGDVFRVYLRFFMKKVITVVVNSEHEARFWRPGPDRAQSRIYSLRIAEVDDPDTPQEREKPVGNDGGYLWRLHTYWRFLARDGGVHVQCEAISLTRGIPFGLGWMIGPFITSIPRESLIFTLDTTRKTLAQPSAERP
jgi:hypothetical protein